MDKNNQGITCGHKTFGVQWFASICSRINSFLGGYERAPKTQVSYRKTVTNHFKTRIA